MECVGSGLGDRWMCFGCRYQADPANVGGDFREKPPEYAACVVRKLADTRRPPQIEPHKDGIQVIVPQKFSADPSAIFEIEDRSSGSSIKLYESMSNVPIRPGDIKKAAEACISG